MGFNSRNQSIFITDPGLFETEKEAAIYCDQHSDSNIMLGYKLISLGKMEIKKKIRKLKPCPFCGSKNLTTGHIYWDRFAVECDNCRAHGPVFDVNDVVEDSISKVDAARVKELEKCLTKKSIDAWNEWALP